MFHRYSAYIVLFFTLLSTAGCNKTEDPKADPTPTAATIKLIATLNGMQETPVIATTATGTLTGTYDPSSRLLTYTVVYQNFGNGAGPTLGHIHQALPGTTGPSVTDFATLTSPISGTATLTEAAGNQLLSGNMYVNLPTAAFPNGEIRGNILTDDPNIVQVSARMGSSNQVPTNAVTATGTFTGFVNKSTRLLTYSVNYEGFAPGDVPTEGHIHQGAPGTTGSVIVPFASVALPLTGSVILLQADVDRLFADGAYVDLHTANYPGGAIRGNLARGPITQLPLPTAISVSAILNSAQQVPTSPDSTVASPATGTMTGTYTPNDRKLAYTITYQGFQAGRGPLAGHFHLGGPGVNGNVFATLSNVGTSPITGTAILTQAQANALLTGGVYVNLHTSRYPNGEIRGDVTPDDPNIVRLSATLNGYSEVPSVNSTAIGSMTGTFNKSSRQLAYTITYQGFAAGAGPTSGHFHQAVPGVLGPVFYTLPLVAATPITGTATLTQANATLLLSNQVYVNLHTIAFPNGEIRGDIRVQ